MKVCEPQMTDIKINLRMAELGMLIGHIEGNLAV